ncbi:MAG: hypothetical protein V1702_06455 [Candidatus Woesearchaeota archaeon]
MFYDVIHVEDAPKLRRLLRELLQFRSLSYLGLPTLDALEAALTTSRAKAYVVDSSFPRTRGAYPGTLYKKAIEAIKAREPDAEIFLFSGGRNIAEMAAGAGVSYIPKLGMANLVEALEDIIAQHA